MHGVKRDKVSPLLILEFGLIPLLEGEIKEKENYPDLPFGFPLWFSLLALSMACFFCTSVMEKPRR